VSLNGVFILDKPVGMTSHDVVNRLRRRLGTRRIGHAGTLDPDATGVLVLCVGEATRLLEFMAADNKEYEGTVHFGIGTDTDDASGREVARCEAGHLKEQDVLQSASQLLGSQMQQVPAYSAVHVAGRRAYEYAREQREIELPIREVQINALQVLSFHQGDLPTARFQVSCSKGTYIRALCRDWGAKLGMPAHLSDLRRTRSGSFGIFEAVSLQSFEESEEPQRWLLSGLEAVRGLAKSTQTMSVITRLTQGQQVLVDAKFDVSSSVAILTEDGQLAAIAQVLPGPKDAGQIVLKPKKVFWKRDPNSGRH